MNAEKIDMPDELRILDPESQKKPVMIGTDAYMVYPLTEGQAERVSQIISDIILDVTTLDVQCPDCNYIFKDMLGRQETCNRCGNKKGKRNGHQLVSLQKTPVEALTHKDRIPILVEKLVGIPAEKVKEALTINQFKHLAAVLYDQNFNEERGLPDDSRKNFQALLGWVGLGAQTALPEQVKEEKESTADSEKSMKPLPTNTDLQESISGENGNEQEKTEKKDS